MNLIGSVKIKLAAGNNKKEKQKAAAAAQRNWNPVLFLTSHIIMLARLTLRAHSFVSNSRDSFTPNHRLSATFANPKSLHESCCYLF